MALFEVVIFDEKGCAHEYEWTGSRQSAEELVEKLEARGLSADYWEV